MITSKEQLLSRIEKILAKLGDDPVSGSDEAKAWRSEVKRSMLSDNLKEHDGIKMIVEKLTQDIEDINYLLINASSSKLPEAMRDRIIDKKKMYLDFLDLFPSDTDIALVEQVVAENEKHLGI